MSDLQNERIFSYTVTTRGEMLLRDRDMPIAKIPKFDTYVRSYIRPFDHYVIDDRAVLQVWFMPGYRITNDKNRFMS